MAALLSVLLTVISPSKVGFSVLFAKILLHIHHSSDPEFSGQFLKEQRAYPSRK
jgi:hypothetical protein